MANFSRNLRDERLLTLSPPHGMSVLSGEGLIQFLGVGGRHVEEPDHGVHSRENCAGLKARARETRSKLTELGHQHRHAAAVEGLTRSELGKLRQIGVAAGVTKFAYRLVNRLPNAEIHPKVITDTARRPNVRVGEVVLRVVDDLLGEITCEHGTAIPS